MKHKMKSLNKEEINFKNKVQRQKLYQRTFMKHNVGSRLFTLQKEAINLTTQTLAVALDPSQANLLNLSEAIGDVETCIEFIKLSIPKLQEASANIKYQKLTNLKARTDKYEKEAVELGKENPNYKPEELTEVSKKAAEAFKKFGQIVPRQKGFFDFFKYLSNYFSK